MCTALMSSQISQLGHAVPPEKQLGIMIPRFDPTVTVAAVIQLLLRAISLLVYYSENVQLLENSVDYYKFCKSQ
jgi:hypothetical protein